MTPEQFNICLSFHKELIRTKPSDVTVNNTLDFIVYGAKCNKAVDRYKVETLSKNIQDRFDNLKLWKGATNKNKELIYNICNSTNPRHNTFQATFEVMEGECAIFKTAKKYEVNFQCIKSLIPRIERWDKYSKMLTDTLGK